MSCLFSLCLFFKLNLQRYFAAVATVVVVLLCAVLIIGHKVRILLHFHSAAVAINLQGAFLAAVDVHVVPFVVLFAVVVVVFEIFTLNEWQHSGRWINTVIAEA